MEDCARTSTPMTQVQLTKALDGYKCDKDQLAQYQSLLGELMHFIGTFTNPSWSGVLFIPPSSIHEQPHWRALISVDVLRYLQGTKDLGICYKHAPANLTMSVWTESSWGEDLDDSSSTNGYLVPMAGGPVAWKSTKQQSVALSFIKHWGQIYRTDNSSDSGRVCQRVVSKELQMKDIIPKSDCRLRR